MTRGRTRRRPPLGQHFLHDPGVRKKILDRLGAREEDAWLEIGAGHGEMTLLLAGTGALVAAVEHDARLVAELRPQLSALANVKLVEADILRVSLEALAQEHGVERWRVYGNLPYYITSPILHRLFEACGVVTDIHIVIQREVAERLCAGPGSRDYGYLSVVTQFYTQPEILMRVPRGAFRPPPKVESSLVRLLPPGRRMALGVENDDAFLRFVQACFRQKRRTLRANLRGRFGARVEKALKAMNLQPRARGEELSLEQLASLYDSLETSRR
ncbi:MAG: 16S rRNA (adenine(1518)-N(6)/adenine(1519)-N(6))-dimethyltransferase RsmA [Acidobacteria bacterium]|nr:16S rRNA (adenine(1518)-N(6)/adenine(1519)-N(6))-dimethyltransferase RsmA [Acidobacteriota bacterium]